MVVEDEGDYQGVVSTGDMSMYILAADTRASMLAGQRDFIGT